MFVRERKTLENSTIRFACSRVYSPNTSCLPMLPRLADCLQRQVLAKTRNSMKIRPKNVFV